MIKYKARKTAGAAIITLLALAVITVLIVREIASRPTVVGDLDGMELGDSVSSANGMYYLSREFGTATEIPAAIAYGLDGHIYVAGEGSLFVYDTAGSVLTTIALDGEPSALAIDQEGLAYVGMIDHVVVIDLERNASDPWAALDESTIITSIAVAGERAYVADAGNRVVLLYDTFGRLLDRIDDHFIVPSPFFDVATDPEGDLWIADTGRHKLMRYDDKGVRIAIWGKVGLDATAFSGCCNPAHFAITSNGLFITSEKGLQRIKIHDSRGAYLGIIAGPRDIGGKAEGLDLAIGKNDEVLVLLARSRMIRLYERTGGEIGSVQ